MKASISNPPSGIAAITYIKDPEAPCFATEQDLLHRSIVEWNATRRPYPSSTIQERFAAQVERAPERPALIFAEGAWTYRQLDERSSRLAHHLRSLGVDEETLVGLLMPRGPEMIVEMIAILKAGGAYVPMDPEYPRERLAFMLADTDVEVVITETRLRDRLPSSVRAVCPTELDWDALPTTALRSRAGVDHLAYVCYTSGSTGRPKGVAVPHRGVMRLLFGSDFVRFGPDEACLQLTPISFDVSVFEIWGTLLHGGQLVLYPPGKVAVSELAAFLERTPLTTAWLTAGLFHQLVEQAPESLRGLDQLLAGGDALSASHVERALRVLDGQPLINGYGPTECTTFATTYTMLTEGDLDGEIVPIGRPIANTQAYVLDARLRPVATSEKGELLLGGVGLARGYFKRPGLTAERFVPHPYAETPGERLYHTGDLVSHLPDGRLLFHGRTDHQVKIRGFRIELGEIDAALTQHNEVRSAVVVARPGVAGEKTLVAYVARRQGGAVKVDALRRFLGQRLPDYMQPATFVFLDALPLNPNGKVDRKALPEPGTARPDLGVAFVAPQGAIEEQLAGLWQELLGLDEVGRDDDFLELGGHSLLIGRLATQARDVFGVAPSLSDLHAEPTLRAMATRIEKAHAEQDEELLDRFEPAPRDRPIPLSFPQERVWFLYRLAPENIAYNTQATVHFRGPLRIAVFARVLNEIVRRHAIFRTSFPETDGQPVQVIHEPPPISLPVIDLALVDGDARQRQIPRLKDQWFNRPYDLQRIPLARWALLRFNTEDHLLLQSEHHFVHDGWSLARLLTEYELIYEALSAGRPLPADPEVQFIDYAWWQHRFMRGTMLERYLDFWTKSLAGYSDHHDLPLDRPRPRAHNFQGKLLRIHLDLELCRRLRATSRAEGVTLFTTMFSAFSTLLHRYSGQRDLLIGSAFANRTRREFENMIGMVVNTLVLRAQLFGRPRFRDLLARVRETCIKALGFQDMPLDKLVEALEPERDLGRNPLFQTMFSFHDSAVPDLEFAGLEGEVVICHNDSAKTDLGVICIPRAEQRVGRQHKDGEEDIEMLWEYSTDLFDETTIQRLIGHYLTLLRAALDDPTAGLDSLELLSPAESQQLLHEWNDPVPGQTVPGTLPERFKAQAARTPEAVALVFEDRQLSYAGLARSAAWLGDRLRAMGVGPDVLVGIAAERSLELVPGLLAVLAAGGAYLPLDPAHPKKRLAYMIEDAFGPDGTGLLLTQETVKAELPELPGLILFDLDQLATSELDAELPGVPSLPEHLAYTIYTSGSTGQPKGVMIPHQAILNHLDWIQSTLPLGSDDAVLHKTLLSFDASLLELFWPLLAGARLIVSAPDSHRDPAALCAAIERERVTFFQGVPSLLGALADENLDRCSSLRWIFSGGDVLTPALLTRLDARLEAPIFNFYGPTEAVIEVTMERCQPGDVVALGRPIDNPLYLVDSDGNLVPRGVQGEIVIGGENLARGYLGRSAESAARFTPDPFSSERGARLYRSGDLGRQDADGKMHFLGRLDHQVKVRGVRIELGEIEAQIARHPAIAAVAVTTTATEERPEERQLVAHVAPAPGHEVSSRDLRTFLLKVLPDYLVPALFLTHETLPLFASGKVDRAALERAAHATAADDVARSSGDPRSPIEELIFEIWQSLLKAERIGIDDNFFALGGHSLLATQVIARLRKVFAVEVPLPSLFAGPTIAELALVVEGLRDQGEVTALPPLVASGRDRELPLSFAQESLWFIDQLEPGEAAYHLPLILRFDGALDVAALTASLAELEHRHEVLRTRFAAPQGDPVQVIDPPSPPTRQSLPFVDLSALPESTRQEALSRLIWNEALHPFDLSRGPVWRRTLLRLSAAKPAASAPETERHVVLLSFHHIAADGWSMGVLLGELEALYRAFTSRQTPGLPKLAVQYADFALWQRQWLQGTVRERQLAFWRQRLGGGPPVLELPFDRPRPPRESHRGGYLTFPIEPNLTRELEELGQRQGVTLFMAFLAAYEVLLHRYTGQRDLVIGTPIAGRRQLASETLIGFFVNTLALRQTLDPDAGFLAALPAVRDTTLEAYAHQDLPFDQLVEDLQPERSLSHNPLFQVMFAIQPEKLRTEGWGALAVEAELLHNRTAKFDLTLTLKRHGDEWLGALEYAADLFDRSTLERMSHHWRVLLGALTARPEAAIAELPFLEAAEQAQLLREWQGEASATDALLPVHRQIEEQARRRGDAVALASPTATLSYAELDRRANRLARFLRARGVTGARIAVCLERSAAEVTALLGILKAGQAYVPFDRDTPRERLRFMVADCGAEAMLVDAGDDGASDDEGIVRLELGEIESRLAALPPEPPLSPDGLERLAYVIYTSGSTGRPKGVMISHRGLCHLIAWHVQELRVDATDRATRLAGLGFDAAVWELWPYLTAGAAVVVPGTGVRRNPDALASWLRRERITLGFVPTPMAELLLEHRWPPQIALRALLTGGDRLHRPAPTGLPFQLINHYGPTEVTVVATSGSVAPGDGDSRAPDIGRPIAGGRAVVCDRRLQILPIGVPGELNLGGPGLARGYLQRPAWTAEKFVPDPWSDESGARLYRSGDRVSLDADGRLCFLGRLDQQIKIRGNRIELGEIEAALTDLPGIEEAVILPWRQATDEEHRLIAFLRPGAESWDGNGLRRLLAPRLPTYMLPTAFVTVAELPLLPSGKVDRAALTRLAPTAMEARDETDSSAAPGELGPIAELVAGIWSSVLGQSRIGPEDHFFALGGHSLLATRVISRLRQTFSLELELGLLFEHPRLSDLARAIEAALHTATIPAPRLARINRQGELPLSFAQERLWFLDQLLDDDKAVYNVPVARRLTGPLDRAALASALLRLAERHETLRTTFPIGDGEPEQRLAPPASTSPLVVVDLSAVDPDARQNVARQLAAAEARLPFALERGPLLRATLLFLGADEDGRDEHHLLLTLHHIVSDGWSIAVLLDELAAFYRAMQDGDAGAPPPQLPWQYADFAAWQRRALSAETLAPQLAFWRQRLADAPRLLELPTDRPRPDVRGYRGGQRRSILPAELGRALRRLAHGEDVTLFMLLLAAGETLLARYSGQQDFTVGWPVAGRRHLETEGLIGCFVNTLVERADLSGRPSFRTLLRRTREAVLAALAHQDLPFEKLVEELQPTRSLTHSPLFQVLFLHQSTAPPTLDLPRIVDTPMQLDQDTVKFDLALACGERGDELELVVQYDRDLFDATTMARLMASWRTLLQALVGEGNRPISELTLLTTAERQCLVEWNERAADVNPPTLVHELFAAQAQATPAALALAGRATADSELQLSYGELAKRATLLADTLRSAGVGPEVRVALCAGRSPRLVEAMLAILAAGGAYVALDPTYPRARLAAILEDAARGQDGILVLSEERWRSLLPQGDENRPRILWLDRSPETTPPTAPQPRMSSAQAAYVLYTSGSTGRPKGVVVPHRSTAALLAWAGRTFNVDELAGVVAATSINFDLSIFELFAPLVHGGTAFLIDNALALADGDVTSGVYARARLINTVPSAIAELLRLDALPRSLITVNLAGEPLRRELVAELVARPGITRVLDLYGPSEDTTYSTWGERRDDGLETIGRPLDGTAVRVLDRSGAVVPIGVVGELCLSGRGLARGYLGEPGLTAAKFVPSPFSDAPGERLYKSGDLTRHLPDGRLMFLGRIDQQVKVRGFRIELGEIEVHLLQLPEVREAVVTAGDGQLHAWLVASTEKTATANVRATDLRRHLESWLPAHMVPHSFSFLDRLPRLPNGKIDRGALARSAPTDAASRSMEPLVLPRNPHEEILVDAFRELLGDKRIGIHDDFFALGGHSLLATRLLSRLRFSFGVELSLARLFAQPTVAGLATAIIAEKSLTPAAPQPPLVPRPRRDAHQALSFAQERLWFLDQLEPGSAAYRLPLVLRLSGRLAVAALADAVSRIEKRHETLRTTFATVDGEGRQVVQPWRQQPLAVVDLNALDGDEHDGALLRLAEEEARRPFVLSRGPLWRATLLRLAEEDHVLFLTLHHIACDGWSVRILLRELGHFYGAALAGRPIVLPELTVRYADFAAWQRRWLDGDVLAKELAFWQQQLAGAPPLLELPSDRPRPALLGDRGAKVSARLSASAARALVELSRRLGATPFMVLLAAFQGFLSRSTGQRDIIVGAPIAGRNRLELEGMIGLFLNNLVLRLEIAPRESFERLVARAKEVVLAAHAHQDVPFEKIVEALQPQRALSHHPLFQVMLDLHNFGTSVDDTSNLPELQITALELGAPPAKLDLNLHVFDRGEDGLELLFIYSAELFEATTMARQASAFASFVTALVTAPQTPLAAPLLLSIAERHQIWVEWNDTAAPELPATGLHQLVARSAVRLPDAIAAISNDAALSYAELNRRSELLAHQLRELGVGPEVKVGLLVERSFDALIALLGVLAAGGAYVPLDPQLPAARLAFMADDCGATVLLSDPQSGGLLPDFAGPRRILDASHLTASLPAEAKLPAESDASRLAYVVYTSGTTGRPKGVLAHHRGAVSFIRCLLATAPLAPGDTALQLASLGFDASVRELFGPLAAGATVVLPTDNERQDLAALHRLLSEQRVSALFSVVPSLLRALSESAPQDEPSTLRVLMTSGERLFVQDAERARTAFGPQLAVINLYGPTEGTMVSSIHHLPATAEPGRELAKVGRPKDDCQLYVLDRFLGSEAIGAVGEIHLGGEDLARGYLGRPRDTAAKFIPDPFAPRPGRRLYATGDLGHLLADGELELLGRRDDQVKVRGNRVELGEIEATLRRHPVVADAVVIARQASPRDLQLIACLELAEPIPEPSSELRDYLRQHLPDYMVPAAWAVLDRLPRNPNGKIDRAVLDRQALSVATDQRAGHHIAPRSAMERLLATLWEELLELEDIGVSDNFFELGGHSLHGIRSFYRLQERLGITVEARALFAAQTLAELAPLAEEKLVEQLTELSDEAAQQQLSGQLSAARDKLPVESPLLADELLPPRLRERLAGLSTAHRELRAQRLVQALSRSGHEPTIPRRADRLRAPLSWIQETFWFIEQQEGSSNVYRSSYVLSLEGQLREQALAQALQALVARHEILRTRFDVDDEGRPYQEILPSLDPSMPVVDLGALSPEVRRNTARRAVEQRERLAFDLHRPPLVRFLLVRLGPQRFELLLAMHHIVTDNWSLTGVLLAELAELYRAFAAGGEPGLAALAIQYGDYAQWERDRLEGERFEQLMAYWRRKMEDGMPSLVLRSDRPRPASPSYRGAFASFAFDPQLATALEERSRAADASLFMTLLAGYKLLLHRHSGQDDLLVASPNANRARAETEKLLGCFVNMLLLRTDLAGDPSLGEVLARVKETALGAFSHQEMPFMAIFANFPPPDFAFDRSPFQASFTFLNTPERVPTFGELEVVGWNAVDRGATDQDLALWMHRGDDLRGTLLYNTDLFTPPTIRAMVEELRQLLLAIAHHPERRISELS